MALITCPNCGKSVSDRAEICPQCNYQLIIVEESIDNKFCEDCGNEISENASVCPNCGCPILKENEPIDEPQKVEITSVKLPKVKKFSKKFIAVGAVLIIALILIVSVVQKQSAKNASEKYLENLQTVKYTMLLGASDSETAGNLIKSVWYNTIYEEKDPKTDKYTCIGYGLFNDDFNTSLSNLFSDSSFESDISDIKSNQNTVSNLMKSLKNPSKEYEDAYESIKELYDSYLELTNLVINPTGSLQTYSNNFNDADSKFMNAYNETELYVD